ncbi:Ribose-phosphate pyrophosphokinase 2 [Daldinia childiae]|uniref:Ribose-phosphate pyrophosphokinase 2 n=1 Tax=Daldinia childiae TaxID=326645 RepID=UPI0014470B99|nr:Ribose-phosphate pyrophosphokinase 2 [Daldinia childiae]KAF3070947.1 Ribose-phosphate pyrophosphokinase 2 [Daldinia childiae]
MGDMANEIKLLSGNSHPSLAKAVADRLGVEIAKTMSLNYSNQETSVTVGESVRDEDVFILQSTAPGDINDGLMELLIMIHACRTASARRITPPSYLISPTPGRIRRIRVGRLSRPSLSPICCRPPVATTSSQWISTPPRSKASSMSPWTIYTRRTQRLAMDSGEPCRSGDGYCQPGRWATSIADRLDRGFALIHKERPRPNVVGRMVLVGDVVDKVAILVDDMADTCGTLAKAAATVKDHGAREVIAVVTHGILSGDAITTLNNSCLSQIVVTNTVPLGDKVQRCKKLRVIDVSPTIAEAIRRTHNGESVSFLFTHAPV